MSLPGHCEPLGTFSHAGAGFWFFRFTTNRAHTLLACGNILGDIALWNLEVDDENPFMILRGELNKNSRTFASVRTLAFSPQDDFLIAASENCSIEIWYK
jgi:WD40 repeat protein